MAWRQESLGPALQVAESAVISVNDVVISGNDMLIDSLSLTSGLAAANELINVFTLCH